MRFAGVLIQIKTTDELFATVKSVVEDYAQSQLLHYYQTDLESSVCISYVDFGWDDDVLNAEAKEIADLIVESGINRDQIQIP